MRLLYIIICALALHAPAGADDTTLRIACAANFRSTLEQLAEQYQDTTGQRVLISSGATGLLYAQIVNGARFDLLLAADTWRPQRLAELGLAFTDTQLTYATGQLGLVSHTPLPNPPHHERIAALLSEPTARVAIANPHTAPYGHGARQTLQALARWPMNEADGDPATGTGAIPENIIIANNVAQAFQFFSTGNTRYALVGPAQWRHWAQRDPGLVWRVPAALHAPLKQGAIVPTNAAHPNLGRQFLAYLRSAPALAIMITAGYLPEPEPTP